MTWLTPTYTLSQAAAHGSDVWELFVRDWGDAVNIGAGEGNMIFPPVGVPGLSSVAAVAIGPKSLVDRVAIGYNLTGPNQAAGGGPDLAAAQACYPRICSVGSPLLFAQPGSRDVIDSSVLMSQLPPGYGSLAIAPYTVFVGVEYNVPAMSTTYSDAYVKATGGAAVPFGPAALAANVNCAWLPPFLHLLFYVKPPMFHPPTQRAPWTSLLTRLLTVPASVETLFAQIPVFGRKTFGASLAIRNLGLGVTTVRVAGLRCGGMAGGGGPMLETTLTTLMLDGPSGAPQPLSLSSLNFDFLMFYYSVAAIIGGERINLQWEARDL